MRVLVCDDEPLARLRLKRMLEKIPGVECVGEACNGQQLLDSLTAIAPQVVISDIRMPGMDGLAAAEQMATLPEPPALVFCTAHDSHALDAFRVNAVQYLLKPVKQAELEQVLERIRRQLPEVLPPSSAAGGATSFPAGAGERSRLSARTAISARTHRGLEIIQVDDIRFFMADHKYVTVRTRQGEVLIDDALKDLEREFEPDFVRIHRNCLVSLRHIEALEQHQAQVMVRLQDVPDRLPVSRRLLPSLRRLLRPGGMP
jgi:two-component system response regulator AlgR